MGPKFQFYEHVTIVWQPPTVSQPLVGKRGIVNSMSDTYSDGTRDFGVHVNEYGYTYAIPERGLRSLGTTGSPAEIISAPRKENTPGQ